MRGGDRLQHPYMYLMLTQQCHSCSRVPHNVKTSELISMQLTSITSSGTGSSVGPAEYTRGGLTCIVMRVIKISYVCFSKIFKSFTKCATRPTH